MRYIQYERRNLSQTEDSKYVNGFAWSKNSICCGIHCLGISKHTLNEYKQHTFNSDKTTAKAGVYLDDFKSLIRDHNHA